MNFERCCNLISENRHLLRDKKRTLIYLQYHWELLIWKRNKLKLGAIVFIIKEYKFDEIVLWEDPEIKFIRQDTTAEDERKLETLLNKLNWEWNMKNYIALAVVVIGIIINVLTFFRNLYYKYLPTLVYRSEHYDFILKSGFENAFSYYSLGIVREFSKLNFWLIDVLTNFCVYFNIIF